jgi:hypothetical protein
MKITRTLGLFSLAISGLLTTFASSSALMDMEAGQAKDIVASGNVIQVYTYTGVSTEAGMMSTFNQGETWPEPTPIPSKALSSNVKSSPLKSQPKTLYSRVNRSTAVTVESDYVKAIDACTETGKRWNYRDDTCVDKY